MYMRRASVITEEKISLMKSQFMQEIREKMESSNREMKDTLSSFFDVVQELADKRN